MRRERIFLTLLRLTIFIGLSGAVQLLAADSQSTDSDSKTITTVSVSDAGSDAAPGQQELLSGGGGGDDEEDEEEDCD